MSGPERSAAVLSGRLPPNQPPSVRLLRRLSPASVDCAPRRISSEVIASGHRPPDRSAVIDDQLTAVRRYTRAEAAQALNIPDTWLKRWVSARCIPHQRKGDPNGKQQRGVWFTWADVLAIGAMLPELMSSRQRSNLATAGAPSAEQVNRWAHLGVSR